MLAFCSGSQVLPIIFSVVLLSNSKKLFLQFSGWDDEPLAKAKIRTILVWSLPKFHGSAPSSASLKRLKFITMFYQIIRTNMHFNKLKLFKLKCQHLQFCLRIFFVLQLKHFYKILFPFYKRKALCYTKKQCVVEKEQNYINVLISN